MKKPIPNALRILAICVLLICILIFLTKSCNSREERIERTTERQSEMAETKTSSTAAIPAVIPPQVTKKAKLSKVVFYLENSGSMFGYVNGYSEYVDVVSELAEKPEFAAEHTPREFNLINGGKSIKISKLGNNPSILKDKLNVDGFHCGDITKSNLNDMFQIALKRAKEDTISILISDGIYDLQKPQSPMNALATEGKETRSRFIERLSEGGVQTLMIKMNSHFKGNYYNAQQQAIFLDQDRPYYIWILGNSDLLNRYFPDEYITSLNGYSDVARFLKWTEFSIPYQITTKDKKGSFKFDNKDKNKLIKAKQIHNNFQFSFGVDFSSLPFSDEFCLNLKNYGCDIENYSIGVITPYNQPIPGLKFTPSHLITLKSSGNPYGKFSINFNYSNPKWIRETNLYDEQNIVGDTVHTFGLEFLTNAITDAYNYINTTNTITKFNFEITKN